MNGVIIVLIVLLAICEQLATCTYNSNIDLPPAHLSIYFNTFQNIKQQCLEDAECIYKEFLLSDAYDNETCWGYEDNCIKYWKPQCRKVPNAWVQSEEDQFRIFFKEADFGYVREQINERTILCEPTFPTDSSLECSDYLRTCRGRNLLMNFTSLGNRPEPLRYDMNVFAQGEVGGQCKLKKKKLETSLDHMGALQSWAPELRYFEEITNPLSKCDLVIEKPTFVMKIDATTNMYHHFCDFLNLYASLHVNSSHHLMFHKDVHILIWETYTYESPFAETFKAFTNHEIWDLKTFQGRTVCFKNVVLPLLPRMIFGLYYNTPIINGCEKSGLFDAFSEFILHRLRIPFAKREENKIRITYLSRRTKYRRVLNEEELVDELNAKENYSVQRVSFERSVPFKEQLQIIRNTDVLIGMHGAGLAHLLFLPKWASLFELYNCEDPNCYKDLARLRGINYITWEDDSMLIPQDEGHHPKNGAHAKFTNYIFDKNEFSRLVEKAVNFVIANNEFNKFYRLNRRDEL